MVFCYQNFSDLMWEKTVLVIELMAEKFPKILRSLEQFIQTVKGQNNYNSNWKKLLGFRNIQEKLENDSLSLYQI
jgi:hypothetical protein